MSEQSPITIEPDPLPPVDPEQKIASVTQLYPDVNLVTKNQITDIAISESFIAVKSFARTRSMIQVIKERAKVGAGSTTIVREQIKTMRAIQNAHAKNFIQK